ncbi:Dyp-type peroxidase [Nitrincola sp. MINF-07-Sa-05]|uniref:Dyp-type peroxidase n=1 Tax=Nitrincola salilacus TaxID=3400273 RepID=UPI0039180729
MTTITTIAHAQKSLGYFPDQAIYSIFTLQDRSIDSFQRWQSLARQLDEFCLGTDHRTAVLLGVGFALWRDWSREHGWTVPVGMGNRDILRENPQVFAATEGDLWFHIKSDTEDNAQAALAIIQAALEPLCTADPLIVPAQKRYDGKVIGGRFTDGLVNPPSDEDITSRILIGDYDPDNQGGSFVIAQKFVHDWSKLDAMSELEKENMIGRDRTNRLVPMNHETSHIKRVRQLNGEHMNQRLIRQALPYGNHEDNKSHEIGVFFAGYAQSTEVFDRVIQGIVGAQEGFVQDSLFSVTRSEQGNYWYIPSRHQCGLADGPGNQEVTLNAYFDCRSDNGLMFYNSRDYLHKVRDSRLVADCPISERILTLLDHQFSRWHDTWYKPRETPPLGHLNEHIDDSERWILDASVMLRKGKATQLSLSRVLVSEAYASRANLLFMDPDELIIGNMPQLSLGIGSQVMEYIKEDERLTGFFSMLNEYSATGHNAPGYEKILALGIKGLQARFEQQLQQASGDAADFYQAVIWSLQGLSDFIRAYARMAAREASQTSSLSPGQRENCKAVAQRMEKLAEQPPQSFLEGLQLIFICNCAYHQTGEPMSIGRLDQLLIGLYEQDLSAGRITQEAAQEVLDAFWLKMDETVLYNYQHLNDYLNYGTGAVFYSAGNFPQGAAINQWVQQLTVGGYKANDHDEPEDASNAITLMCLRSARRLPLNAPCLSLRVHHKMSDELFAEAAKALLSGGAHPILLNDDKLVPALKACGPLSMADARDYTCDGCYEPIIPGKTEWAFSYVPILPLVGVAMNQGATIAGAGPIHLNGMKSSWNSPPPEQIHSYEQFEEIFFTHWRWAISGFFNTLMNSYGSLAGYCPSPLFSAMLDDSLESGRDLSNGGARYHIIAPMMCGIANAINALYVVRQLVFDEGSARCSLAELRRCLQCNWGEDMKPPFYTTLEGEARRQQDAEHFRDLRQYALAVPKFGISKDEELNLFAERIVAQAVATIHEVFNNPPDVIREGYERIKTTYGTSERPFAFTVTPGVGTFEDNVGLGATMGASADGRLEGQPIADDFCAAPWPDDLPLNTQQTDPFESLKRWNIPPINHGIANAAPVDLNIPENFPEADLTELIKRFAQGELGSNMITITCADPDTFRQAMQQPEPYDLVRVRMGGWTEYYVAMFDFHQESILRRPYYLPQ